MISIKLFLPNNVYLNKQILKLKKENNLMEMHSQYNSFCMVNLQKSLIIYIYIYIISYYYLYEF